MAQTELIMPKMGESITEATILSWLKKEGDTIEADESVLEIATDKVDSEVPSPVAGVLTKILFNEGDTIEVGKAIAIIATEGETSVDVQAPVVETKVATAPVASPRPVAETVVAPQVSPSIPAVKPSNGNGRFYSPLVLNISRQEGISMSELEAMPGTGKDGRVTKKDILAYVKNRTSAPVATASPTNGAASPKAKSKPAAKPKDLSHYTSSSTGNVDIVEMDRMRKMIADHMVASKQISPHVTSFVEADVTNMVNWRNKVKNNFLEREGEKITFTPIFAEACVKAIKDYPMVNVSVDGSNIIVKKDINIGMAVALPSGNLIVPVIRNADQMNMVGLTKKVNDLARRARDSKLKPDEIDGGTFTLTNVGTFGNVMGTPIINQPQVAILATGAIRKRPAVLETEHGDVIAIRQMMFLSLSYDHRVVDGFLGGSFLRRIADYLEDFDPEREI